MSELKQVLQNVSEMYRTRLAVNYFVSELVNTFVIDACEEFEDTIRLKYKSFYIDVTTIENRFEVTISNDKPLTFNRKVYFNSRINSFDMTFFSEFVPILESLCFKLRLNINKNNTKVL